MELYKTLWKTILFLWFLCIFFCLQNRVYSCRLVDVSWRNCCLPRCHERQKKKIKLKDSLKTTKKKERDWKILEECTNPYSSVTVGGFECWSCVFFQILTSLRNERWKSFFFFLKLWEFWNSFQMQRVVVTNLSFQNPEGSEFKKFEFLRWCVWSYLILLKCEPAKKCKERSKTIKIKVQRYDKKVGSLFLF